MTMLGVPGARAGVQGRFQRSAGLGPNVAGPVQHTKRVKSLDLAKSGQEKARRRNKPTEYVDGPTQPDRLHDYQQIVSETTAEAVERRGGRGSSRYPPVPARLELQQTIIEAIRDGDLDGLKRQTRRSRARSFGWPTARTCEQAIDAWSYLWRAVGR